MKSQQSFYPLISNAALYQRMFRSKPYTKCITCLTNDKLKCKKCMQFIIQDITQKDNQRKNYRIKQLSNIHSISQKINKHNKEQIRMKTMHGFKDNKQNEEKIMITSKYNWWLAERIKKRSLDVTIKSSWPKKTKFKNGDFQNLAVQQPKFQIWEKKLIDKLLSKHSSID